jgi:endo-alpha-1,4-polygalactosaminidase (GH114 family)
MLILVLTLLLGACSNALPPAGQAVTATRLLLLDQAAGVPVPLDGSVVTGTISVGLEAEEGIEKAGFLLDAPAGEEPTGQQLEELLAGADSAAPFTFVLDTSSLPDDAHTLTAFAISGEGESVRSIAHASFTVANASDTVPPPADEPEPPAAEPEPPTVDPPAKPVPEEPAPPAAGHWQPEPGLTWYWQLTGTTDMNQQVDVYDIDYEKPASVVAALQAQGRKVIAYVPVGDWESYRPDSKDFPEEALCGDIAGWPERYIDIRNPKAVELIKARIAIAAEKGFDGIEGDVVDLHRVNTGCRTRITTAEMTDFLKDLVDYTHSLGLAYFAKNTAEDAASWSTFTDGVVVEEAYVYREAAAYMPYILAGKPVFAVEYGSSAPSASQCTDANSRNFALYGTDLALTGRVYRTCW